QTVRTDVNVQPTHTAPSGGQPILSFCNRMGRQAALVLAALRVTLWWAAVDAFFAPTPRPLVGLEAQAVNTRIRTLTTDRRGERITRTRCDAAAVGGAEEEAEVVVIGSGIAGLCTAALLSSYGKKVVVCE
ncbi:unnamed protein product, partial [Ectocarpus sp. 8 AP-2014]